MKYSDTQMLTHAIRYKEDIETINKLIEETTDINKSCEILLIDMSLQPPEMQKVHAFPLIESIKTGSYEITKILLNKAANPNVVDGNGDTALHRYLKLSSWINNMKLELFTLLIAKGALISDKDIVVLEKNFLSKLFTAKQLVISMKGANLFAVSEATKLSIAETVYNKLKFLYKDYPNFELFSKADEVPSLLYFAAKASIPIIHEYREIKSKDKQKELVDTSLTQIELAKPELLVQLINKMMPENSDGKQYQLTSTIQIQEIINNIEVELTGKDND